LEQTFLDIIYKIFYDTSQKNKKEVKLLISEKFSRPTITFEPNLEVKIPLPKKIDNGLIYSGQFFEDTKKSHQTVWSLFLSTVYHLAAHSAVTDYTLYKEWMKKKSPRLYWKAIDFIEDDAAERYLSSINPEIAENLIKIDHEISRISNKGRKIPKKGLNLGTKIIDHIKEEMGKEILLCFDDEHKKQVVSWAEKLYKNKNLIQDESQFYYETHDKQQSLLIKKNNLIFLPSGEFEHKVTKLNTLYFEEHERIKKILRRMRKDLVGLNFDSVVVPDENIQAYFELKENNRKLIKKIRQQIQSVANNIENPQTNFFGEIDMEMAIQAIASHSEKYAEVFDKYEDQRIEESWAILIDNSASMKLRFKHVKDFMLCLAEASDELTGPAGVWGLFSFDQKFSVLKDFKGTYNQDVRARIGGLESGGLSFTPDAIVLAGRTLVKHPADIKHLFVFTDDFPTGLWNFDKKLYLAVKEVERMGVEIVGIGLSPSISKYFSESCWGSDIRELISKFVRVYRMKSARNM